MNSTDGPPSRRAAGEVLAELLERLRIPYLLEVESIRSLDGRWVRRASYPELRCAHESDDLVEAVAGAEAARARALAEAIVDGRNVPGRHPARAAIGGPYTELDEQWLREIIGSALSQAKGRPPGRCSWS